MLAGLVSQLDAGPPRRLFAGTDADKVASQPVLEKAGFTRDSEPQAHDRITCTRLCGR